MSGRATVSSISTGTSPPTLPLTDRHPQRGGQAPSARAPSKTTDAAGSGLARARSAWRPAELPSRRATRTTAHRRVVPAPRRCTSIASAQGVIGRDHPAASWLGVDLAAVTLTAMPTLPAAEKHVGAPLNSAATASERRQTMLCADRSAALLVGLLANAIPSWSWADPAVALPIGAVALREARGVWRGNSCGRCSRGARVPPRSNAEQPESARDGDARSGSPRRLIARGAI